MDDFFTRIALGLTAIAILIISMSLLDKVVPATCNPSVIRFYDIVIGIVFLILLFPLIYGLGSLIILAV